MIDKIAAVVVAYNPPECILQNINSYIDEVNKIFIFDNSTSNNKKMFDCLPGHKIKYITKNKNIGIASALNIIANIAINEGYEYLLTMDQDSKASKNMVSILYDVAKNNAQAGIISPLHLVENDIKILSQNETQVVLTTMTSGNLLNLHIYKQTEGFDDKLFIDYVDHEYCLKLKLKGFEVVQVNKAVLYHKVGNLKEKNLFGLKVHPSNHLPVRLYYQTRNRFYLRKIYGKHFPDFFKSDLKAYMLTILKILLFEKQRIKKMVMIMSGFKAYFLNDFGEISL